MEMAIDMDVGILRTFFLLYGSTSVEGGRDQKYGFIVHVAISRGMLTKR